MICIVPFVGTTFQERIKEAIKRAGGQSELARKVSDYLKQDVSPQTIQYLASATRKKPARGSRLVPAIAAVSGLRPEWLAANKGPRDSKTTDALPQPQERAAVILETTMEIDGVEMTREAIELARAFMKLPESLRHEYKRSIETEALKWAKQVPDEQLEHLAAPKKPKTSAGTQ